MRTRQREAASLVIGIADQIKGGGVIALVGPCYI
jgi:hypothetical protein